MFCSNYNHGRVALEAITGGVLVCRCVVIEDSFIGLQAARSAGMRCIVTKSNYTQNEDFSIADAVFDCIADNFRVDDLTTPGKLSC